MPEIKAPCPSHIPIIPHLSILPQFCSIPVGLLEASDLGRLALSLFRYLDYKENGSLRNYNKKSWCYSLEWNFFLALANG